MTSNKYCVIMAGGVGSRFWPISRNERPKQFLDILGTGRTFLQQTYDRFSHIVPEDHILVVTSETYRELVQKQLPQVLPENILCEPFRRNTAPCIAYATYKLWKKDPNATVVVAPSDHHITHEHLFAETIRNAMNYADGHDKLITLGIEPTRPETGYGYIQANVRNYESVGGDIFHSVKTFTEKPNRELAEVFIKSGEFLWNSGIFIWNLRTIRSELERWLPAVTDLFQRGQDLYDTPDEQRYIQQVYADCTSISIDYGVMEKTRCAWVLKAGFGWSDLGTWDSLYSHANKDEHRNFIHCEELMMDKISGSIVYSTEEGKLLAIKGLDNFMIINTDDVLMICPRDEVRFKNMLTDLAVYEKSKYQ
ncbi:MAG: mannose-1-phosphate guanylyltransferase [Bacteroidales bacterium]|nr:mannose-1-phosphate guanylyltransferase [Bacteroidales bacterium]